jgi:hypothetical protein
LTTKCKELENSNAHLLQQILEQVEKLAPMLFVKPRAEVEEAFEDSSLADEQSLEHLDLTDEQPPSFETLPSFETPFSFEHDLNGVEGLLELKDC